MPLKCTPLNSRRPSMASRSNQQPERTRRANSMVCNPWWEKSSMQEYVCV